MHAARRRMFDGHADGRDQGGGLRRTAIVKSEMIQ